MFPAAALAVVPPAPTSIVHVQVTLRTMAKPGGSGHRPNLTCPCFQRRANASVVVQLVRNMWSTLRAFILHSQRGEGDGDGDGDGVVCCGRAGAGPPGLSDGLVFCFASASQ